MKKLFIILALLTSLIAILFSVLPISNLAIFPAGLALIFVGTAFYLSKKTGKLNKIIPFTFYLTLAALALSFYKSVFTKTEVANTEVIEAKEEKLEQESIKELEALEIELDENDLEDLSIDP